MLKIVITFLSFFIANFVLAADEKRAIEIVGDKCYYCHGMEGEGSTHRYPRLAGQREAYIIKQLTDFRAGERTGTMNKMAAGLTDEEIKGLASYFSKKPTLSHTIRKKDKEIAEVGRYLFQRGNKFSGVIACAQCHGEKGDGTDELPRLAGQHKRYVVSQLLAFNKRKRTNDNEVMHSVASKLTRFEIEALSTYVSGLK